MVGDEKRRLGGTDWLDVLSFGFFLVLLGAVWIVTPNLTDAVTVFFKDLFNFEKLSGRIPFPAPDSNHPVVYTAAMQFCLVFGIFFIVVLILRFAFHESINRKASTISSIIFWFAAAFFLNMLANESIGWFSFLAGIIVALGLSIIGSNLVKLLK